MNGQKKKIVAWIAGVVVLIVVIIGGIFRVKHYVKEQTYEKPINEVIKYEHNDLENKDVSRKNSKIVVYDYPNEGNNYLITVTYYLKNQKYSFTDKFLVDKGTHSVEEPDEILPVSNLKKLYESDYLQK